MTFNQISKAEFFSIINDLDVCYNVVGYNFEKEMRGEFKFRDGTLLGKNTTNYDTDSDDYGQVTYEIRTDFENVIKAKVSQ